MTKLPTTYTVTRERDGTWSWIGPNELVGWAGGFNTEAQAIEAANRHHLEIVPAWDGD